MTVKRALAGVLLVLLAVLALPRAASARETRVVAIGNNLGRPGEIALRYAEDDAVAFATVLQQLGDVGGDRVTTLLGRDAAAARAAILDAGARLRAAGPDSVLVVYYSGHADAVGLHLGAGPPLPYDELRALVAASPAAMRLLVLDSCRSGGATRVKGLSPAPLFPVTRPGSPPPEGLAILTSSAAGEDSHESERLRSSFFSHHLVTGLRGAADADRDGAVTLSEAYDYAYHETLRASGQTTQLQHPTYAFDVKGRAELVLTRLDAGRGGGRLALGAPGTYLVMEGGEGGAVVAEVVAAERGATLVLPARRYLVQRRGEDAYREWEVDVRPGAPAALEGRPSRTIAYARLLRKGGGERAASHAVIALGGGRGAIVDGQGVSGQVVLGYALELPWLSLGIRARLGLPTTASPDGVATITQSEVGVALTATRFVDLDGVSLGVGVLVEAGWLSQSFATAGEAPDRTAFLAGFGATVAAQIDLGAAFAIQLEGGPMTYVYERAVVVAGAVTGTETATALTGFLAGGLVARF
ncbi:MAG: caspase family protein [Myxococcales bacterium]|nr:caspase family protein [Myxococcales bacterium]MCB9732056.1 caspase family protein [Deltaproteobacteria bacterium]